MGRSAALKPGRPAAKGEPPARWLTRRSGRRWTTGLIVILLVAATSAGVAWWTSRPGEMAPPFALPASTGETVRLEDYRGRQPVLLVFYMVAT